MLSNHDHEEEEYQMEEGINDNQNDQSYYLNFADDQAAYVKNAAGHSEGNHNPLAYISNDNDTG